MLEKNVQHCPAYLKQLKSDLKLNKMSKAAYQHEVEAVSQSVEEEGSKR